MTSYVCVQLSNSVPQTCEAWAVNEPLLPPLSPQEAIAISGAIFLVCAVAYNFQLLFMFIKRLK